MPIPPLLFLEPRDAVQRVCNALACTEGEAVAFLRDAWFAGTIVLRFVGPPPPAGYDLTEADWFSGEIVIRTPQQTSTIPIGGYDPFEASDREQLGLPPREYRYPMRTVTRRYPFKIDRCQLDAIMAEAVAAIPTAESPVIDGSEPEPQPATDAAGDREASQSEKAKVRRRVKQFLEEQAVIVPPHASTKAGWRQLARERFGQAMTDNLFDEAWQEAALPAIWRAPGRRT